MAPTDPDDVLRRQTSEIIQYLLADDHGQLGFRGFGGGGHVEVDGPDDDPDFDPIIIADKLRQVADSLNDSVCKAALNDFRQAAAQEAAEAAFSSGVEALCSNTQVLDVAPEMQLIKASVTFGLFVKKSCPELRSTVQRAMTAFLTRRVGPWVTEQGGWAHVPGLSM